MILGLLCEKTMKLEAVSEIVQPIRIKGSARINIEGIAYDSRAVKPGFLFVAVKGRHYNGADFIDDAIEKGAVAVISEENGWTRKDVTHIWVEDSRRALAEVSCAFYNYPSRNLNVIGITGTNGKTSTAYMARAILEGVGRRPGLISTVCYEVGNRSIPADRTTPESTDLQCMLDQMVQADCRSAVMEVSSHALDQKRVWGIDFDVGVFTNLSQDHLDYHGSMDRYFAAKAALFRGLGQMEKRSVAVINLDDAWGHQLVNIGGGWAQIVTFGQYPAAMVRAENITMTRYGSEFDVVTPWGHTAVRLNLPGEYNISNALAAIAACGALGVDPEDMAATLAKFTAIPGRMERIPTRRNVEVYVDYAHTDDALSHALTTLRKITRRKLTVVFGCGGNRDEGKRPLMGRIASHLADRVILTTDNPRKEDPAHIVSDIRAGVNEGTECVDILDREEAIARAIREAGPGDVVLVAGKGHENYQEFEHTVVPFDDREVCRRVLSEKI